MVLSLRGGYARVRRVPVLGGAASRLVWSVKGALGLPVRRPAEAPAPALQGPSAAERHLQHQLDVAFAAMEAMTLPQRTTVAAPAPFRPAAIAAPPLRISVVVNTLDRASHLRRVLSALRQVRHPAFEVIVVAGPSRDGTEAVLAEHAGDIRVGRCPEANLARSRNIGVAMAAGEIIAFIDDDAVPEPDWLDELERGFADPQVAGVGGAIRDRTGVGFQCIAAAADRFGASWTLETASDPSPGPAGEVYLSLTGANCAFRREALAAIGGFDEAYAYFLEETDVCLRLVDAGYRLAVVESAEVHHAMAHSRVRDDDDTPRDLTARVRSTAYFALRHGAPRHGFAAAARRIADYVEALEAEQRRRLDTGVIDAARHAQLFAGIRAGLREGTRAALAPPVLAPAGEPAAHPRIGAASWRGPHLGRPVRDRLRLCLVSQDYPPDPPGGIAVWTGALAQGLAEAGHEVSVVARARDGRSRVAYDAGVWVHRAGDGEAEGLDAPLPDTIRRRCAGVRDEVARVLARRRFDLAMGPIWDLEPAALLAEGAIPTVVSLHTPYALALASKPAWLQDADYRSGHVDPVIAAERALLAGAPHLLANSCAIVRDMAEAYGLPHLDERATMIPHGLPDRARGVRPTVRDDGTVDILFVGRLEPRKGADLLLEVAPQVLQAAPHARLTLVGDDAISVGAETLRAAFEQRWRGSRLMERIAFAGVMDAAQLHARYAACDLVVAPSRYESFGLVVLEAMMFAKPCLACDAGGVGEIAVDGETAVLVGPGDARALARALLDLIAHPERRRALGAAGRRRYEQRFTAEIMVRETERFFDGVRRTATVRRAAE